MAPARLVALGIGIALALAAGGCGADGDGRPPHGYVAVRAVGADGTLYLGGVFREPPNPTGHKGFGHELLVVLDATDPAAPRFVAEHDLKLTQPFAVIGGALIAAQHGSDEEMLDGPVGPPGQNARVKVYGLADPHAPALAKTIELPGGVQRSITASRALDAQQVLISVGAGDEDGSFPLTWIVRPGAAAGSEVVGSANRACRASVLDGTTLWCFAGLGRGTGYVAGYTLGADGSLTALGRVMIGALVSPRAAVLTAPGGAVVLSDQDGGTFTLTRDGTGAPSVVAAMVDFEGGEVGAVAATGGRVVVQTSLALRVLDPATLAAASTTSLTGEPYGDYLSAGSVARLDARAGAGLDGLIAASLGDYGVALLREDAGALAVVGGYYRRFGTDFLHQDDLSEGNY